MLGGGEAAIHGGIMYQGCRGCGYESPGHILRPPDFDPCFGLFWARRLLLWWWLLLWLLFVVLAGEALAFGFEVEVPVGR